jgi:hypothetical protein
LENPWGLPTRRRLISQSGCPAVVAACPSVLVSGGMNLKAFLGMVVSSLQCEGHLVVHLRYAVWLPSFQAWEDHDGEGGVLCQRLECTAQLTALYISLESYSGLATESPVHCEE